MIEILLPAFLGFVIGFTLVLFIITMKEQREENRAFEEVMLEHKIRMIAIDVCKDFRKAEIALECDRLLKELEHEEFETDF